MLDPAIVPSSEIKITQSYTHMLHKNIFITDIDHKILKWNS